VSEYSGDHYLAPDNDEWDQLQAVVAELEESLMGCENIVAKLACICDALRMLRTADGIPPDSALPDQPSYDTYRSPVEEDEGDPPSGWETWPEWKVAKCKGAQKIMDDIVDWMSTLIQWSGAGMTLTFVVLESALVATTIIPPVGVVMMIASLIAIIGLSLIQQAAQDWIVEHKQCLVCAIFNAATVSQARADLEAYIDAEWDIAGSPAVFRHLLNDKTLSRIFDGNLPDYDDWKGGYSAAYCAVCSTAVTGSDWWASPLDENYNTLSGASPGCWDGVVPSEQVMCGLIWRVQNMSGSSLLLKCMSNHEAGCDGGYFWPNTSQHCPDGVYFSYKAFEFNNAECKAQLCPTATEHPVAGVALVQPPDVSAGFHFTGDGRYVEIVFLYQVFKGIAPPCQ